MNTVAKKIGIFGFFTLTGSMILTVYSYPVLASSGFSLVFFLLIAALFYFIPAALVSAELATTNTLEIGGVYKWCSVAFTKRWGFFAIFLQWAQITVGFLAMLYFIVGSISYVIDIPSLNTNSYYKFLSVMLIFWLLTLINFKGAKFSAKIASIGVIAGVVIPIVTMVILLILYVINANPIHVSFKASAFFPDFMNIHALTIFVTFILAYAGIEASAVHVNNMVNPQRNYPTAIVLLSIFAISVAIIGSLSIAIVIPNTDINMSSGVVQTFEVLLKHYHLKWLTPVFALLLAIGALAEVSSWIVGPSEGILVAAEEQLLPKWFAATNKHDVPVNLIITQAIVVTIWAFIITLGGGGSNLSFMIAMALAVLIYLTMYVLLFLAYFIIKYKYANKARGFIVPGGRIGRNLIPIIGLLTVIFAIIISFFPPIQIENNNSYEYELILSISFICVLLVPNLIYSTYSLRKDKQKQITRYQLQNLDYQHHHKWIHLRGRKPFCIQHKE
ncbi:APC family permease [Thiotrichales bacterium 19S3-7]|nr:APC family permease [Thiotrichales bacterium 19S3-7]MCF6801097.1 APC family permease [Thiotrichales bacterium 19S3-11]